MYDDERKNKKPRLTTAEWDEKNREWNRKKYEELYGILNNETTPADELIRIGGGYIPMDNLVPLSRLLVSHPNATPEVITEIIEVLHGLWWGEAPRECQVTWECIEKCYFEYIESGLHRSDWLESHNVSISSFNYVPLQEVSAPHL